MLMDVKPVDVGNVNVGHVNVRHVDEEHVRVSAIFLHTSQNRGPCADNEHKTEG